MCTIKFGGHKLLICKIWFCVVTIHFEVDYALLLQPFTHWLISKVLFVVFNILTPKCVEWKWNITKVNNFKSFKRWDGARVILKRWLITKQLWNPTRRYNVYKWLCQSLNRLYRQGSLFLTPKLNQKYSTTFGIFQFMMLIKVTHMFVIA